MKYDVIKDYKSLPAGAVVAPEAFDNQEEIDALVTDGTIAVHVKEEVKKEPVEKVGDVCTTEDGKAGTLQLQEDGTFVCVADEVPEKSKDEVKKDDEENTTGATTSVDVPVKKFFNGDEVISDGYREVNGKQVKHIRVASGAEFDLSDEEYAQVVPQE